GLDLRVVEVGIGNISFHESLSGEVFISEPLKIFETFFEIDGPDALMHVGNLTIQPIKRNNLPGQGQACIAFGAKNTQQYKLPSIVWYDWLVHLKGTIGLHTCTLHTQVNKLTREPKIMKVF
ncbi:hypothetical protein ACJX0J_018933, partial [Zea mays]